MGASQRVASRARSVTQRTAEGTVRSSSESTMSTQDTTEAENLVRELYRTLYEQQAFDAVPEFCAPAAVRHGGLRGAVEGREAVRAYLQGALGGLSDIEVTELRCLAADDLVAYDFEMVATHSGELMGVPATGNRIELENTAWFRIDDGKVVDEWPRTDMLGLLGGIGAIEVPF